MIKMNNKYLLRETSVYGIYRKLKNNSITSEDYFDLIRVPDLRVYAGKFLKTYMLEKNISQRGLAKVFCSGKSAVAHWKNNRCAIPLKLLAKITDKNNIYNLIENEEIYFRDIKVPIKFNDMKEIIDSIYLHSGGYTIYIKKLEDEKLNKIQYFLGKKMKFRKYGYEYKSKHFYNFIKTFFEEEKVFKILPPLTDIIKKWEEQNIDFRKAVICPLFQTDGSCYYDRRKDWMVFSFKNKSLILHEILVDAMYATYKILPTSFHVSCSDADGCFYTHFLGRNTDSVYRDLKRICGDFKHSPSGQRVEEYMREYNPHLNYLLDASSEEQKIALRLWFSADGCIIPTRNRGYASSMLKISCAHPKFIIQLKEIFEKHSMHLTIKTGDSWSGYNSLYNMAISTNLLFLFMGGFIKGVNVTKNSNYHAGIEKQDLLLSTLELMRQEHQNPELKKLSIKGLHRKINKIAIEQTFKTPKFYIDYFSNKNPKVKNVLLKAGI